MTEAERLCREFSATREAIRALNRTRPFQWEEAQRLNERVRKLETEIDAEGERLRLEALPVLEPDLCHHQAPGKAPGVIGYVHPMSEPCALREAATPKAVDYTEPML